MNTPDPANDAFQNWLIDVCTGPISQTGRERRLVEWQKAPSARYCHPREEHLLPLHVCVGVANNTATLIFDDDILGDHWEAVKGFLTAQGYTVKIAGG